MSEKSILFLALEYPYGDSNGNLYSDLMEEFRDQGYKVCVLASANERGNEGVFTEKGIAVARVKTWFHQDANLLKKGWSNITLPFLYNLAIRKYFKKVSFSFLIVPTPPITLLQTVRFAKKQFNIPCYLILRDIFPQNAVDLKMIRKNGLLHLYFKGIEKKLYEISDSIGCMSPKNIEYINDHHPSVRHKTHILRNWQKFKSYAESNVNAIREEAGLSGKFIILYGGNISKPQKTENILQLAKKLHSRKEILFYFVGKGSEKKKLKRQIETKNIENVKVEDYLPREEYEKLLKIADVGLVSLHEDFTIPNFPSKAISYFAARKPILAMIDTNTDFGTWIEDEVGAGFWAPATDFDTIIEKLGVLMNDSAKKERMGNKGYDYAITHLTPSVAYTTITEQIGC